MVQEHVFFLNVRCWNRKQSWILEICNMQAAICKMRSFLLLIWRIWLIKTNTIPATYAWTCTSPLGLPKLISHLQATVICEMWPCHHLHSTCKHCSHWSSTRNHHISHGFRRRAHLTVKNVFVEDQISTHARYQEVILCFCCMHCSLQKMARGTVRGEIWTSIIGTCPVLYGRNRHCC